MIITKSPVRISFCGGGTDFEYYFKDYTGAVVSTSIDKYFYTFFKKRKDKKIQVISSDFRLCSGLKDFYDLKLGEGFDIPAAALEHFQISDGFDLFMASEIPPGTGLGSSGTVAVNLVHLCCLLRGKELSKKDIAEKAYHIGRNILQLPIGKQDEYASSFGGLNLIEFTNSGVNVEPIKIRPEIKDRLEKNMLLFFTGKTRSSTDILKSQTDSATKREPEVMEAMHNIKEGAYEAKRILEQGDLKAFAQLLNKAWQNKKKMSKGITNPLLNETYDLALSNGALGGKVCGAGGGGYFMFYCEEENHKQLKNTLENKGLKMLDFKFDNQGTTFFYKA